MKLTPKIITLPTKQLVGMSMEMSLAENKTGQLFRTFMPRRAEITGDIPMQVFDLRIYPEGYFKDFRPDRSFIKWALIEVDKLGNIPTGMSAFSLRKGLYAIFDYKGLSNDPAIFQYIFASWLPHSKFILDQRPHFEILGEHYRLNDPESEEKICIPIQSKS